MYLVSFTDYDAPKDEYPRGRRIIVGEQEASSAREALETLLPAKLGHLAADARPQGIKRTVIAGLTFVAEKVS